MLVDPAASLFWWLESPIIRRCVDQGLCYYTLMVSLVGPRAMIRYKPRQARKGATVVADSCAVVWLTRAATQD